MLSQGFANLLLFIVAVVLANLPYVAARRFLGVWPVAVKSGWLLCIELALAWVIVGLFGLMLESSLGQPQVQRWEFYAVAVCLFVVLGFPGFVYRFLWRSAPA